MKTFRYIAAVGLGGLGGSIAALQLLPQIFWWVGMIAGGLIAVGVYDAKGAVQLCIEALAQIGFSKKQLKAMGSVVLSSIGAMYAVLIPWLMLIYLISSENHGKHPYFEICVGIVFLVVLPLIPAYMISLDCSAEELYDAKGFLNTCIKKGNPLSLLYLFVSSAVPFLFRLLMTIIKLMHQDRNDIVLVFVDTALSVSIAYLLGSAATGFLVGIGISLLHIAITRTIRRANIIA